MVNQRVNLTQRDRQILQLVALGRTNGEIANELGITFSTAKWHISQLLMKANVNTREELAQFWATERDLRRRLSRAVAGLLPFGPLKLVVGSSLAALVVVSVAGVLAIRAGSGDFSSSSGLALVTGSLLPAPTVPAFETQRGTMIHGADTYLALHSTNVTPADAGGALSLDTLLASHVPPGSGTFLAAKLVLLQTGGSNRLVWALQWEPPAYFESCPRAISSEDASTPSVLTCTAIDPETMFHLGLFDAKTGEHIMSTEQMNPALVPIS